MRVGVDATCWHNRRGYGRHARALLHALVRINTKHQYTFFLDLAENLESIPAEAEVRLVGTSKPATLAASSNGHRSARDMWRMSRAMADPTLDVLLFPTVYSFVPVFGRAKKVVMIHDVIAEKYPDATVPKRSARLLWKTKVLLGRWQADAIATVSDYSRQTILNHFRMPPERVFVVGEASDPIFRVLDDPQPSQHLCSLRLDGKNRLIVYVGGFSPHKNLESLITEFANLSRQEEFWDARLVMVGEYEKEVFHSYFATIHDQVRNLGLADRVVFTGYLSDEDLVVLLNRATVLVLPSFMEGFGLPAIEAAACGCPAIATNESPLPGLLGAGALYVNPRKPEELQAALTDVLTSEGLRKRMRDAGLEAASQLSWEAAARQMLAVMQRVVA